MQCKITAKGKKRSKACMVVDAAGRSRQGNGNTIQPQLNRTNPSNQTKQKTKQQAAAAAPKLYKTKNI